MAQITTGIRSIFNHPWAYNLFQASVGSKKAWRKYAKEYIRAFDGVKLLDIGCGTADILDFLPPTVDYFGFDLNENYINYAKRKFGLRGTFVCNDVNNEIKNLPKFDIILATGLLHHLNDDEVRKLFNMAASGLKEKGRLITFDGCYVENQSKLAKFIISKDRGQNIRTPEGYKKFALQTFEEVKADVRHDLIRIPYTHIVMECSKPRS